jgi:hypothetical protein
MANTFRYVVRNSDGSIKALSRAPNLSAGETETLVERPVRYAPGRYYYDFVLEEFVAYSEDTLATNKAAADAANAATTAAKAALVQDIKAKAATLDATQQSMWQSLGQLLGYDFGP